MKSACSSQGDDARQARQGAVGLRNIAVCCEGTHFYLSVAKGTTSTWVAVRASCV